MTHTSGTHVSSTLLDVASVLRWAHASAAVLERARPVIDRANVFPVPDADTGTNLLATLARARDAAVAEADDGSATTDDVLHALAHGALLGARGSSGVIMSEFLRGFAAGHAADHAADHTAGHVVGGPREAEEAGETEELRKAEGPVGQDTDRAPFATLLARALACGADRAVAAVVDPRPGTMLTAARGAADAASRAAADGGTLDEVLERARAGAGDALRRSVDELDELRRAGVLDAGAYGFVLVLDALCEALGLGPAEQGETDSLSVAREPEERAEDVARAGDAGHSGHAGHSECTVYPGYAAHTGHSGDSGHAHSHGSEVDGEFEVMCVVRHVVLEGTEDSGGAAARLDEVAPTLRAGLQQVGDSVVVVGGPDRGTRRANTQGASAQGAKTLGVREPGRELADREPPNRGTWQVHVHTDHPVEALRVLDRWEVHQVVVRCLAHQVSERGGARDSDVGLVACTSAPGLVTDLARSGAVVVLRGSGPVERDDLLRAVHETDAEQVVVLPADEATLALARTLTDLPRPQVTAVASTSDLHVVAALSAWVSDDGSPARQTDRDGGDGDDGATPLTSPSATPLATSLAARTAAVSAVVQSVRAVQADSARPAELARLVEALLGPESLGAHSAQGPHSHPAAHSTPSTPSAPSTPAVLTVLAGDLVPASVLTDLVAHAERLAPGLETVVLHSGRRSTALVIGAEQQ